VQLLFQRLEELHGSVRAHLDDGTDHRMAEIRRLLTLGARDVEPGRGGWHVLRDVARPSVLCHQQLSGKHATSRHRLTSTNRERR
jgi:hypothetical protein